jgi:hypothetical protein
MIRQRTAVKTEDDHQPRVTGNLFETDGEQPRMAVYRLGIKDRDLGKWRCSDGKSMTVTTTILVRICTEAAST